MYEYQQKKNKDHPIQRVRLSLQIPLSPKGGSRTLAPRMWEIDTRGPGREWIKKWLDDSIYTQRDEIERFVGQMEASGGVFTEEEKFLILYAKRLLASKLQTTPVPSRAYFQHAAEFVRLSRDRGGAAPVNIDEAEIEMVQYGPMAVPCVRVYRISFAPVVLSGVRPPGISRGDAISPNGHHDVQQDDAGNIVVATGKKRAGDPDSTIYMDFGRPDRAFRWALKYRREASPGNPVIRSFLIPIGVYKTMVLNAKRQTDTQRAGFIENSDYSSAPNQLGIIPRFISLLRETAIPGSLISYPLDAQGFKPFESGSGVLRPISEISKKIGIEGDFQDCPELFYDAWLKGGKMKTGEDDGEYAEQMSGLCDFWNLLSSLSISRKAGEEVDFSRVNTFLMEREDFLKERIRLKNEAILSKNQDMPASRQQSMIRSLEAASLKTIKMQSVWATFLKVLKMSGIQETLPEDYHSITKDIFSKLLDLTDNARLNENMKTIAQLASVARANAILAEEFSQE